MCLIGSGVSETDLHTISIRSARLCRSNPAVISDGMLTGASVVPDPFSFCG
jgi:hypothetical protein